MTLLQNLVATWKRAMGSPRQAIVFVLRRAVPFGIRFKDLEAYRICRWSHGSLPRIYLPQILPGIEHVGVTLVNLYERRVGLSVDAQELMILCAIERFLSARNVIEIGTYDGNTALNLAANLDSTGRVTTVDLPPNWDGAFVCDVPPSMRNVTDRNRIGIQYRRTEYRSEERRVGKECRSRWSPYH